jgi:hypothetical protein
MRNILFFLILIVFASCSAKKQDGEIKKVVITGKIIGYDGKKTKLYFLYSIPGCNEIRDSININKNGFFKYKLSSYIPLDAMILDKRTNANINFIYHPGDSINIEFEAKDNQIDLLNSVAFSGNQSKTNNDIIKFQALRESNNLGYGIIDPESKYKLSTNQFVLEMDKIKDKQIALLNKFLKDFNPTLEAKTWASIFAVETYYYYLYEYNVELKKELPSQYSDYLKTISPIRNDQMICWNILNYRISRYLNAHIFRKFSTDYSNLMDKINSGKINKDSLLLTLILDSSTDSLLNQLTISNYYVNQFENNIINGYKENSKIIQSMLGEQFIYKSLNINFEQSQRNIYTHSLLTLPSLNKIGDTPIETVLNKIYSVNKGKVIFMDIMSTSCGGCIRALPDFKKLVLKMGDKDVSFVLVCLGFSENRWEEILAESNLIESQHFFMVNQQIKLFLNIMRVDSFPSYFLINKSGQVAERGSYLHPEEKATEEKITTLLTEK